MKRSPKVGDRGHQTFTVDDRSVIDIADAPELAVLSTPSLIWFLEHAARDALAPLLDDGETSVGVSVDVQHLAATPRGFEVRCTAQVIHVDRSVITFQIVAEDPVEMIARGLHKRRILPAARLQSLVKAKLHA